MNKLEKVLVAKRIQIEPLSELKVLEIQRSWCCSYLGNKVSNNKLHFFWEAFTNNLVPHVAGDSARNLYRAASGFVLDHVF